MLGDLLFFFLEFQNFTKVKKLLSIHKPSLWAGQASFLSIHKPSLWAGQASINLPSGPVKRVFSKIFSFVSSAVYWKQTDRQPDTQAKYLYAKKSTSVIIQPCLRN